MQENIIHIIGTDLLDYSFKVEKAIKEGYTFSDKNEYAPRAWPHMFEAWMLLNDTQSAPIKSNDTSQGVDTKNESESVVANSNTVVAEKSTKQVTRRGKK